MDNIKKVLITGGAGYVGCVLVPHLLQANYKVRVLDLFLFGDHVFDQIKNNENLELIKGDIRDPKTIQEAVKGCDAVIHLACISNDPSFELNPELGKSINFDAFRPLVKFSKDAGVKRFIYASSSSVYGIKEEENVTEDLPLEPLTDYSKFKAMCEEILAKETETGFTTLTLRPATVCGYSTRLRLDLSVNILTNHAVTNRVIKVFGGDQLRPNFHVKDAAILYLNSLRWPSEQINQKIYNAGYQNLSIMSIAKMVQSIVGEDVKIVRTETDDNRSYHISSEKIKKDLGFVPKYTVEDAIHELVAAFNAGTIQNSMTDSRYFNVKLMQEIELA